jgi:hypothetical protein
MTEPQKEGKIQNVPTQNILIFERICLVSFQTIRLTVCTRECERMTNLPNPSSYPIHFWSNHQVDQSSPSTLLAFQDQKIVSPFLLMHPVPQRFHKDRLRILVNSQDEQVRRRGNERGILTRTVEVLAQRDIVHLPT